MTSTESSTTTPPVTKNFELVFRIDSKIPRITNCRTKLIIPPREAESKKSYDRDQREQTDDHHPFPSNHAH